ncbi:MAG: DUF308 domain-containing protein [Nocardioides sp.]
MSNPVVTESGQPVPPPAIRGLAEHWGLVLTYAIITLGLGVALLVWPDASLKVFAFLLAVQLIVTGIFRIVQSISADTRETGYRVLIGLAGGIALIVGLLILRDPLHSVLVLTMILGAFWLISGVIDVVGVFVGVERTGRGWELASGVLSIIVGGILLVYTDFSVKFLVVFIALWLILVGAIALWAAFRLRSARLQTR